MLPIKGPVLALAMLLPLVAQAHHSRTLNYTEEMMTVEGDIKSTSWRNPHCSMVLEVTEADGSQHEWLVEMLAKIALLRNGFDFGGLEVGTHVKITGLKGRKERTTFFRSAELPDGRIVRTPKLTPDASE